MNKKKIIVILGQTSTGKSDFAVEVAKKINGLTMQTGEIISADSRQVYKGMDLGTGKITKKEMQKVPHYLLDVISPKKIFSVSDFQKKASKIIKEIEKRNNIPIICGGTGFYIDSVINQNIFPKVPPNKKLRKELENKSKEELFEMLIKLDKDRAKNIDSNNKVRLIRAIEIIEKIGKVPQIHRSDLCKYISPTCVPDFKVLKIGLTLPTEILKERIKTRLLSRIKKGMIKEVKDLHEKEKISWKRLESLGLEYRYVSYFLQNKMTKDQMIEKLYTEIWHFAKRQNTWFKRDKEIIWIDPRLEKNKKEVLKQIQEFLKK